jgi:hypothetical protein
MNDTTWADTLKPGNKVTVVEGRSGSISILTVVRVTPKQIVVKRNDLRWRRFWRKNLQEVGASGPWDFSSTICETTPEHRQRIRRSNLIYAIHNRRDDSKITLEVAEKVYAILDKAGAIKKPEKGGA